MSATTSNLTVGGALSVLQGAVFTPSGFSSVGSGSSVETAVQNYLSGISAEILSPASGGMGVVGLINQDLAAGGSYSVGGSSGGFFEEYTNINSAGLPSAGTGVYTGNTANAAATGLLVEAPGRTVLTGNGATSFALFGANSNVVYTDTNGGSIITGSDSIIGAGGKDVINVYSTNANSNSSYDITVSGAGSTLPGAGKTTVNSGAAYSQITADGNSTTTANVYGGAATVTANDASYASVQFGKLAGGTLDFINNSSNAATIYSGNYGTGEAAPNSVTAYGGAGGGFFVGGRAGDNSLVGGSGAVTLQGAGNGDFLQGNSSASNFLFAGTGAETLEGSATSANNTFQLGLSYTGSTGAIVSNTVVSTAGAGSQDFILGSSSSSTLSGSNAAGAENLYIFVENAATNANGPSNYLISNFNAANSSIYLNDSIFGSTSAVSVFSEQNAVAPGFSGAIITLSDGTTIKMAGVNANSLTSVTGATGIMIR